MRIARAPGRVNLIGEHTDHAGGLVLPVPVDLEVRLRFTPREDGLVRLRSEARPGEEDLFAPASPPPPEPGDWRSYARGVAALLHREGVLRRGLDGVLESSLPVGAGLASSAALEAAVALALLDVSGTALPRPRVAELCREAEHRWSGVACGAMDQMAVLVGEPGAALRLDCSDGSFRSVHLPDPAPRIVVIDTGVRRELARSPYNDRVREAREALAAENPATLPDRLARRRRHVEAENARVDAAAGALEAGDLATLGQLLDESHASLRDDFEVSWPEADRAAVAARSSP
jgi:galactokinase